MQQTHLKSGGLSMSGLRESEVDSLTPLVSDYRQFLQQHRRSWCPCERVGIDEARLFARDEL
jgi:hypothetical protein